MQLLQSSAPLAPASSTDAVGYRGVIFIALPSTTFLVLLASARSLS